MALVNGALLLRETEPRLVASIRGRAGLVLLDGRRGDIARLTRLTVLVADGGELPKEFILFRGGENETTKGSFLFDAKAAEMVMAAADARGGVDYPIDLEHLSLDDRHPNFDTDARGWFRLAVRGGDLWAVDVRWTPDGARRLAEKSQRYISPAFFTDDEGRITEIVNVALVAMPATQGAPALIAATRRKPMTLNAVNTLSARIKIARGRLAKLADDSAGSDAPPAGKFAAAKSAADAAAQALTDFDAAAQGSDIDATFAAMEAAVKACDAFEQAVAAIGGGATTPPPADDATPTGDTQQQMSAREKTELIYLRAYKRRHEEDAQVERLAAEMKAEQAAKAEHASLDAEMVRAGYETPESVKQLASLSLTDKRKRVEMFRANPRYLGGPKPPTRDAEGVGAKSVTTSHGPVALTALEIQECERAGAKLEAFAENKARRLATVRG